MTGADLGFIREMGVILSGISVKSGHLIKYPTQETKLLGAYELDFTILSNFYDDEA